MRKLFLLTLSLVALTGCSYFSTSNQEESETIDSQIITSADTDASPDSRSDLSLDSASIEAENAERSGVFNEEALTPSDLPKSSLNEDLSYAELDAAIDDYYAHELTDQEKDLNHQEIDSDAIKDLQYAFDNNSTYKDLSIQVDQVKITMDGQSNYVLRLVSSLSYQEAEAKKEGSDLLMLNEAFAQVDPKRIVLLEYFDQDAGRVTPIHLSNSTNAIFFNQHEFDKLN